MAKKTLEQTLKRLKKRLLKELDKSIEQENRQAFTRSLFVYDFTQKSLEKEIRVDIEFGTADEGKTVVKGGNKVESEKLKKKLVVKFKNWLNVALEEGIKRAKVKRMKSRGDLIQAVEATLFGRANTNKIEAGTIAVWKSKGQLWFFSGKAKDQKNAFRGGILKYATQYAEQQAKINKDPEYILFYTWLKACHVGHTFGLKAEQVRRIFKKPQKGTFSAAAKTGKLKLDITEAEARSLGPELEQSITQYINRALLFDIDVDVEKDIKPKKDGVVLRKNIGLILQASKSEFATGNTRSGAVLEGKIRSLVTRIFDDLLKKEAQGYAPKDLTEFVSSKTVEKVLTENVGDLFSGKKPKGYKQKKSKNTRVTKKVKNKVNIQKYVMGGHVLVEGEGRGRDINKPYIKDRIVNRRMHDQLQRNMGKGNSKQILNYQTGRFAKSVEVEQFLPTKEKGAITAITKFYGFPYSRFADRTDPLWKPGRDIKGIIGRSIRQILQEEKIVNLRRVKVELRDQ